MSAPRTSVRELTVRGVVLGGIITLVFTAANVYLGLKVGLTFATSIPAAVISMALLRRFANHSIRENNIVQTIASAAGTLSAIIFVLPGLVIVGWWTGFPYWMTVAVVAIGGVLGVMYSIPLRRALVTGSPLPYPEGVAGAEVLKVGDSDSGQEQNRRGLATITLGAIGAALVSLLGALKVASNSMSAVIRIGSGGTLVSASLSMALVGVGHLVGLSVGIAMLVGVVLSYFILLPTLSQGAPIDAAAFSTFITSKFAQDIRLVGAGAIAIAAVWTLIKIIRPILKGIVAAVKSARLRSAGEEVDVTERDIPIHIVGIVVAASMVPIAALLWLFASGTDLSGGATGIVVVSVLFVLVIGLFVASVCGYMAGLIGASNSPISGVGILVVLIAALLIRVTHGSTTAGQSAALIAYTIFTAAIVFGVATISNDNLQDLKTGQLVGSTPWKQQVALVIGVLFGAAVIPPIMELMFHSFGFAGAPGAGPNALAAPQANLIATLAQGVFGNSLNWNLIGLGVGIGVVVIVIDEVLAAKTNRARLPALAVGMGMYLPMSSTLFITLGAVIGHFYNKWAHRRGGEVELTKRMGVLLATGMIVGESLFGVIFAAIVAGSGKEDPLAVVGKGFSGVANIVGVVVFVGLLAAMYRRTARSAR